MDYFNHHHGHESLGKRPMAEAYFGPAANVLREKRKIKERTIRQRRLINVGQAAYSHVDSVRPR